MSGVAKNEIEVTIEDNRTLRISGEHVTEEVKGGDNWHVVERACGHFVRRFRLPKNADLERITADVKNGVLTIIVPKIEPQRKQEC
jgi:HSP20 family protein